MFVTCLFLIGPNIELAVLLAMIFHFNESVCLFVLFACAGSNMNDYVVFYSLLRYILFCSSHLVEAINQSPGSVSGYFVLVLVVLLFFCGPLCGEGPR